MRKLLGLCESGDLPLYALGLSPPLCPVVQSRYVNCFTSLPDHGLQRNSMPAGIPLAAILWEIADLQLTTLCGHSRRQSGRSKRPVR